MKRIFDFSFSLFALILTSPILLIFMLLVYLQDKHSPFYIAERVSINEGSFNMIKLRSMIINADKSGVDSTSNNDNRITPIGEMVRRFKLDELTQLWNVLIGDMSLVGPRPNVRRETDLYSSEEKRLLSVKPGITDLSSIVFSDEGSILADKDNPDLAYNQLIRPWKSRLGLMYIENQSMMLDVKIIFYTVISIFSKKTATKYVVKELYRLNAPNKLIQVSERTEELIPFPPPGMDEVVLTR